MASMAHAADLVIIGGGAAGLTAAIFAAEAAPKDFRIIILDSAKKLGAKILVSGGGRCNVTNRTVLPVDFNGSQKIVRNILAAFDQPAAVRWFNALGVSLKEEPTGKLFPKTDQAGTVLNALLRRCDQSGVTIQPSCRVTRLSAPTEKEQAFTIQHEQGVMQSGRVIFCTGGRSLPKTGSDGAGWEILRRLSHTITPTYAALVPLVLSQPMFHTELSGIAQEVELSVFVSGKRIDHRTGSLLWTHFGISGPVVMDASRHWTVAQESGQQPKMLCNLLPGETFESVEGWLMESAKSRPRVMMLNLASTRFPERVASCLLKHAKIDPASVAGQLSRESRRTLVHAITALVLPVTQHRGWNYAEVTAGGVPLNEIDFRTMESRIIPGLHLAGEVLDCDGRIGGFNFQWAWATGHLAGRAAVNQNT